MALTMAKAREHLLAAQHRIGRDAYSVLSAILEGDLASERALVDQRAKTFFWEDFLAAQVDLRFSSTAGSGTANAALTTVAGALGGMATLKSASDNGTHAANNSSITFDQLNYKASQGGLLIEVRAKLDVLTSPYLFIGFTDTISTTVESPIFMNAAVIDSDATDACGVMFDTAATVDKWTVGGVKNDVDTDPLISGLAPTADTFFTVRAEVDSGGGVTGYIDGVSIGYVANAVTTTVALTPTIVVGNNTAAQHVLTLDYVAVQASR